MEPLPLAYSLKNSWNYLLLAVSLSLFCVGLAFWSPISLALVLGAVFVCLFFSGRTFRWMVFPTILILDPFLIRNLGLSFQVGGLFIQPIDWIAILLLLGVLFKQVFTGEGVWMRTGLDGPVWFFLGATAVSLLGASDLAAGIVNWGHMALFFIAFYAMVTDWQDVPPEQIWQTYFFWAFLAAVSAVWQFFVSGGARSLGFSGLALTGVVVPVLCYELVQLTHQAKTARWFMMVVFMLTALASQTRGLWLNVGVLLIVWLFSGYFLKPFRLMATRRIASQFFKLILLLLIIFFLLTPFLEQVEQRAEQIAQRSGTIYLRLFLWGLAWQLFWEHPVTGIGMGQFAGAVEQFPGMKNLGVFERARGLSAHNLILSFLAETGLVGSFAFFLLLVSIVRFAWKGVQKFRTIEELRFGWGLFLIFSVLSISFPFLGVWGYHFTFFLALLVLFVRKLETPLERADGR